MKTRWPRLADEADRPTKTITGYDVDVGTGVVGGGGQIMRSVEQRGVTQLDCRERMDGTGRHDDKSTASKRKRINGGNGP
ncbi:hypothetical protein C0Q70_19936 [Pomacea canaliculata]|uniref:Uncharacterized protein n=1 Tax=Pomacea canaliculata TaxID=400727 RepID=A0A2T7NE51_POMCA|nr:hypothetical protein C0Q70_19936 [Pomacea canaliculata]